MKGFPSVIKVAAFEPGEVGVPGRCGIANAIRDSYKVTHVKVGKTSIGFSIPDQDVRVTFSTPLKALKYIQAHDKGLDPEPVAFTLDMAEAVVSPISHWTPEQMEVKRRRYALEKELGDHLPEKPRRISRRREY